MSKARNLADLLSADGDVKASALDNVSGGGGGGGATSLDLAFASFSIDNTTGILALGYYGASQEQNFAINANGELEVTV